MNQVSIKLKTHDLRRLEQLRSESLPVIAARDRAKQVLDVLQAQINSYVAGVVSGSGHVPANDAWSLKNGVLTFDVANRAERRAKPAKKKR